MKSLYDIDIELQLIMTKVEAEAIENEGEFSDLLGSQLDSLHQDRDIKIGNICRYIKSLKGEAEMVANEARALSERSRVTKNKAEALKKYLSGFIPDGEKFADEHSKISWRKSEAVLINEDVEIPEDYQKVVVSPDKTSLKKAIKAGEEFDGITLVTNQNIQIK